jgi:uncharacterized repeat protein (TIGR01451 family)
MVWSLSIDRGFTTLAAFTRSRGAWAWPLPTAAAGSADLDVSIATLGGTDRGSHFNYIVYVTNHGPDTATNVQLTNTLPAGTGFVANSGDCTSAYPCAFASIASGTTKIVTTSACVPSNYGGANPIQLLASASSDVSDPVPANNNGIALVMLFADGLFASAFESCP